MSACDACLRRAALVAELQPWLDAGGTGKAAAAGAARAERRGAGQRRLRPAPGQGGRAHGGLRRRSRSRGCRRSRPVDPLHARGRLPAAAATTWATARRAVPARARRPPGAAHGRAPGRDRRLPARRLPTGSRSHASLGRELAACGVPVVSGMALGVDSAAHEGALEAGGLTVAVMGGGADVAYPRSKRSCTPASPARGWSSPSCRRAAARTGWSFPARNRIMAGLAAMTVVVEGATGSGSLITADFAQGIGREVGAVPGQVTSPLAAGALHADRGRRVRGPRSPTDVLDAVYGPGQRQPRRGEPPGLSEPLQQLLAAVEREPGRPASSPGAGEDVGDVLAGAHRARAAGAGPARRRRPLRASCVSA